MTGENVVVADSLTREYHMGDELVRAVRGVSLSVARGDYVAIVGPSGCGKSTLLNLLGGIDRPSSGSVSIDGRRIDQMRDADATRFRLTHIGFVFQRFYLMPALTAIENVELPMAEAKLARPQRIVRARELLAYVGLGARRDHRPAQMSGGEQQRVAIARAVAKRPDVLLCDEPTGALDADTGRLVLRTLADVNATLGTSTMIITHNAAIAAMGDRVLRMASGRITEDRRNATRASVDDLDW